MNSTQGQAPDFFQVVSKISEAIRDEERIMLRSAPTDPSNKIVPELLNGIAVKLIGISQGKLEVRVAA